MKSRSKKSAKASGAGEPLNVAELMRSWRFDADALFAHLRDDLIDCKISDLSWSFQFRTSGLPRLKKVAALCGDYLQTECGTKCPIQLTYADAGRQKVLLAQVFVKMTKARLHRLHEGMRRIAEEAKVEYGGVDALDAGPPPEGFVRVKSSVGEDKSRSAGELDCSTLRFDGLYRSFDGDHLRFSPDGVCVNAVTSGEVKQVAKFLKRGAGQTEGTYVQKGSRLAGELSSEENKRRGVPGVRFTLKGRLTKKGLKVVWWSSYSNKTYEILYEFYPVSFD